MKCIQACVLLFVFCLFDFCLVFRDVQVRQENMDYLGTMDQEDLLLVYFITSLSRESFFRCLRLIFEFQGLPGHPGPPGYKVMQMII